MGARLKLWLEIITRVMVFAAAVAACVRIGSEKAWKPALVWRKAYFKAARPLKWHGDSDMSKRIENNS